MSAEESKEETPVAAAVDPAPVVAGDAAVVAPASEKEPTTASAAAGEAVEKADAAATPANGQGTKEGGAGAGKNPKGQPRKREEQKPIEELFDLTKPIPRVEKPNKEEHEKVIQDLSDVIKDMQEKRKEIQDKIDKSMDPDAATKTQLEALRTELNALKKTKSTLISEKKALRTQLDMIKNENEKILKDKKDAKSNVKFSTVEEIDKQIKLLQKQQETTSMSLNDEKRIIKEIDALKASKKTVTDIKSKDAAMDDIKVQRKTLGEQVAAKDKEIDAITAEMDKVNKNIDQVKEGETAKRGSLQDLFKERDALRKQIADKLKEKDALRDEFRKLNDAWFNYQRALRAQKKIQYEEEKAKRDAERAEYEAQLAAEEAKKVPYEEEQALCEFLANYLERTYLGKEDDGDIVSVKKEAVVAVKEDPFAGFKPVSKKDDEEYFGKGKGKKKRDRSAKKLDAPVVFTLSVDTFEQFGMIQMDPPTKLEEVEATVKQLREKKLWYKEQPRGSVPTALEIRRQNEKKAAKRTNQVEAAADANRKDRTTNKFSLDQNDFVPLGGGVKTSTGGINASSWGQSKSAAPMVPPSASDDDAPTPAEAS